MAEETKKQDEPEIIEGEVVDAPPDTTSAIDLVTRAEIDMQIATAHRFPRSIASVKREIMDLATIDEETAAECFYSLPRGGKTILGPSIRMAEIALSSFGNVRAATRFLGESEDGKFVRVLGICHDLQKNVAVAQEVTRRITDRNGRRYNDDMVATTIAAAASLALRNASFRVVPRTLINPAFEKCKAIVRGDAKTLNERRHAVIEKLQKLSSEITLEKILFRCGVKTVEEVNGEHLVDLIGAGTAIKDGVEKVEAAFPSPPTTAAVPSELDSVKPAAADDKKAEKPKASSKVDPEAKIDEPTAQAIRQGLDKLGIPPKAVEEFLMTKWGIDRIGSMNNAQALEFSAWAKAWKPGESASS